MKNLSFYSDVFPDNLDGKDMTSGDQNPQTPPPLKRRAFVCLVVVFAESPWSDASSESCPGGCSSENLLYV